ncbi:hypothetical protein GPECTOR_47g389 [Gonium pectorale]|uniref:Cyclin N-terminal domain-containing protein n=1 Tax=Gonium pectorale TaxID=33097 RepID=A0A150G8G4_GONPE|nr:hypothetical protein GPECTOR_47g389 [Gonium pectorale]|eukprot:KXZ46124.1 hypothetical protein GPECTOR_47g389 [Gonium pectorale]
MGDRQPSKAQDTRHHRNPYDMYDIQPEIGPRERIVLVDWLGELRDSFRLQPETLFLSAAYVDAFLSLAPLPLGCLQLLGMAAVWLAAKLTEVHPPGLADLLPLAEGAYSREQMTAMEERVLKVLSFSLTVPTPFRFAHYLMELAPLPPHPDMAAAVRQLAEALAELSLLDTGLATAQPSAAAAAAVYLAMEMAGGCGAGLEFVAAMSGLPREELEEHVGRLAAVLCSATESRPQQGPCALAHRYLDWEARYGFGGLRRAAARAGERDEQLAARRRDTAAASRSPRTAPAA